MQEFILREGTLNDDILSIPSEDKVFKGGYIAIIEIYTFASAWHNNRTIKKFRKETSLDAYLAKNYPEFDYYN